MSNTCFVCHGPDEEDNFSGYRLDSQDAATTELPSEEGRYGIVPHKPDESEAYLRIAGLSDYGQMPPEDFRHQLTDYDKALFRKWIEQGAEYQKHWAYDRVQRPARPELSAHAELVANPIDAFILARLEQEGVEPSELADRATLLRRLSLDMIGLPPTVDELQDFLSDDSEGAYRRQVDRLLSSEHYGERMASEWLDLVRFADTVGFHGDQNMRIFPYRDYVIQSLNENKPFDQFTREQLAGDLLPNPTDQQLVATGMLRLNMVTREGGAQPKEYLAKYRADRVRTLGTAWLGATLGCCECHNHKYDPFSARDFYSFGAFFDDLRQWGVYSDYGYTPNSDLKGFNNDYPFPPEIRVESPSRAAEIRALAAERDAMLLHELGEQTLDLPKYRQWEQSTAALLRSRRDGWLPLEVLETSTSHESSAQVRDDGSVLFTGKGDAEELITIAAAASQPVLANSLRVEVLPSEAHGGRVGRGEGGRFSLKLSAEVDRSANQQSPPKCVANRPRFVRIELPGKVRILSLAEVQIFTEQEDGELKNIAPDGAARQSSTASDRVAKRAIDGETDGDLREAQSTTHTNRESRPWWEVDLGSPQQIAKIVVWNRTDGDLGGRLDGYRIVLLDEDRRTLFATEPETPAPSLELAPPAEVQLEAAEPIVVAWAQPDRQNPTSYVGGAEPLKLGEVWRSGPGPWQLPDDEAALPHTAVYHFERPEPMRPGDRLIVKLRSGDVGRVRLSLTPIGHAIPGWSAADDALIHALSTEPGSRTTRQKSALVSAYHRSATPIGRQLPVSREYRDRIIQSRAGFAMSLIAQSLPEDQAPVSRVLPRGNWQDESGELAPPDFPKFLSPSRSASRRRLDRLDLANWIVSEQNPLTPRHFVNRTWKHFFGTGLSAKVDDLGNQGEWPSHPLLLDWLAAEFVESGWDMEHIVRLIVESRTYRQAAAARKDLLEIDPYNRLLAQQSARRLEAEAVRDNALAISGLLRTDFVGGPSVYPYQPAGHYANLQFPDRVYQPSRDWRQYRRGVYMHWQRTFLHPMLVNFDAPSRDECTADRPLSNSPQQALTLLNDPTFVEASRAMADRLLAQQPDAEFGELLRTATIRAIAREPTKHERNSLQQLFERQREHYRLHPEDAQKLLAVGHLEPTAVAAPEDVAALAQVCRVILNLHETITRY